MSKINYQDDDDTKCYFMNNPRFLIICTGYNCEKYVKYAIDSIKAQTYTNYKVVLVDDGSTDKTGELIVNLTPKNKEWTPFHFKDNRGTYYAREFAIEHGGFGSFFDYDVIVMMDMDDQLLPHSLARAAGEYYKGKWMTYGNYVDARGKLCAVDIRYPDIIHEQRSYRKDTFRCTHLRTFRKELYEAIPKWELTKSEINSYPDAEILFSMMEMCGKDRIGMIAEPTYVYNNANPISTLNRFGKDVAGYNEIINRPKRELISQL